MTRGRFSTRHGLRGKHLVYEDAPSTVRWGIISVCRTIWPDGWDDLLDEAISKVTRRPKRPPTAPEPPIAYYSGPPVRTGPGYISSAYGFGTTGHPLIRSTWESWEEFVERKRAWEEEQRARQESFARAAEEADRRRAAYLEQVREWQRGLEQELLNCEWFTFFDIVEEVYEILGQGTPRQQKGKDYEKAITSILYDEGIGYIIRNGRLERFREGYADEVVQSTRTLLQDGRFEGANTHFEKALEFLNRRPLPDCENCVKDAVGAVEATARILADDEKALFPAIIEREPFKSGIHGALREAMKRVYGYRGDVGGVAHGLVGQPKVGVEEAELVLGICASAIVYLVNKFGTQPP